jgi:hypothetical protein
MSQLKYDRHIIALIESGRAVVESLRGPMSGADMRLAMPHDLEDVIGCVLA